MSSWSLARKLRRTILRGIREYGMIPPGSEAAIAVSGGKDSLALAALLHELVDRGEIDCRLHALHVHMPHLDPARETVSALVRHFDQRGYGYDIIEFDPDSESLENRKTGTIDCFRCSWVRRKHLFLGARNAGCGILATGHHRDDIAQTVLMNILRHGECAPMEPSVSFFKGKIILVRPGCFAREKDLAAYSRMAELPVSGGCTSVCDAPARRHAAEILATAEQRIPLATYNILKAAGIRVEPPAKKRRHSSPKNNDPDAGAGQEGN